MLSVWKRPPSDNGETHRTDLAQFPDREVIIMETGGLEFVGLLGLIYILLKLFGVIGWSWLWVLSPFWITAVVLVFLFGSMALLDKLAR